MNKILFDPSVRAKMSKPFTYKKNEIVCTEKSYCSEIGIILEGELEMVHYTYKGKEVSLAILKANDVFGEFLIFSNHPFYPGTLVVKERAIIQYLSRERVSALLRENEDFRMTYLNHISQKALSMNRQNKLLMQHSIREKIQYFIAREASYQNPKVPYKTKTDLAKKMNVQRPSLVRELRKMKEENLIDYDQNHLWFANKN